LELCQCTRMPISSQARLRLALVASSVVIGAWAIWRGVASPPALGCSRGTPPLTRPTPRALLAPLPPAGDREYAGRRQFMKTHGSIEHSPEGMPKPCNGG